MAKSVPLASGSAVVVILMLVIGVVELAANRRALKEPSGIKLILPMLVAPLKKFSVMGSGPNPSGIPSRPNKMTGWESVMVSRVDVVPGVIRTRGFAFSTAGGAPQLNQLVVGVAITVATVNGSENVAVRIPSVSEEIFASSAAVTGIRLVDDVYAESGCAIVRNVACNGATAAPIRIKVAR
jgi:hypothetical protein